MTLNLSASVFASLCSGAVILPAVVVLCLAYCFFSARRARPMPHEVICEHSISVPKDDHA